MALSELIANADTIVVARCTSVHSYWHDNKILTDNHLEIEHVIKGDSTGQHVVTTLGGTAVHPRLKAPVNMAVPGGASFVVQEEVLIFTQKNSQGINQIVGFTQGKFTIETDDSGKKLIPVAQKKITNKDDADSLDQLFSPFTTFDVHYIMIKTKKIELSEMISKITSAMAE